MPEPRLLTNVFSNWVRFLTIAVVSFFLSPFLVHRLGDVDYGLWSLTLSAVGYLSLLDLGINAGVVRFVARGQAAGDRESLRRTIGTSQLFFLAAAAAIVVLSILGSAVAPSLFAIPESARDKLRALFLLAGLDLAVTIAFAVWNASLVGLQRYAANNAWTLGLWLAKTGLIVLLVRAGFGVRTVAIVSVAESLIRGLGQRVLAHRFLAGLPTSIGDAERSTFREIASYGVWTFLIAAAIKAIAYTDHVVVGAFMSPEDVTRYDVGSKLVNPFYDLFWAALMVLTPLSAGLDVRGDRDRLRRLHVLGTKGAIVLSLPVLFFFVVCGRDFLARWMGPAYADPGYPVLAILAVATFLAIVQQPSVALLRGIGHVRTLAILYVAEGVVNVVLSIVLVRRFGLVGVALGTFVPLVISNGVLVPLLACHVLGLPVRTYLREAILPALGPGLVSFGLGAVVVRAMGPVQTYAQCLIVLALAAAIFWIPAPFLTISGPERKSLVARVRRTRPTESSRAPVP